MNQNRCEYVCDKCGKELNMIDIMFHDSNGTLCKDCFISKMIFDALKNIKNGEK